jgi:hypothetical protein
MAICIGLVESTSESVAMITVDLDHVLLDDRSNNVLKML